jgi:hypothetical protein
MGISSRDYYRAATVGGLPDGWGITPVVTWLIVANVVLFLLQVFVVRPSPRHGERGQEF